MRKSQLYAVPDFGELRSNNRYSTTYLFQDYTQFLPYTRQEYIEIMHKGGWYLNKTLSLSPFSAVETFESTENKRPDFNSCRHQKNRVVVLPYSTASGNTSNKRASVFYPNCRTAPPASIPFDLTPVDWGFVSSNLQAEAYHTMIPKFEGDISLINALYELKDFRDISKIFSVGFGKISSFLDRFNFTTRRAAEVHLVNSFAIQPLLKDLKTIIGQAQHTVMNLQEEFAMKGQQPNIRHFSKLLNQSQTITGSGPKANLRKGFKDVTTFTATMEGDYGYTSRRKLDALLQYWGMNFTFEAVWNALPFSFLVDYFFSIGHSLHVMRKDPNVSYNVRQYSESVLSTRFYGYLLTRPSSDPDHWCVVDAKDVRPLDYSDYIPVSGYLKSDYSRVVKSPYWGPFLPRWKVPSGRQALNIAALIRVLL